MYVRGEKELLEMKIRLQTTYQYLCCLYCGVKIFDECTGLFVLKNGMKSIITLITLSVIVQCFVS